MIIRLKTQNTHEDAKITMSVYIVLKHIQPSYNGGYCVMYHYVAVNR